ncbi:MAG: hypothetical protein IJA35_07770 [Clostridia bacterium]|nr:hypothetical protein [Clostridia bacterium]
MKDYLNQSGFAAAIKNAEKTLFKAASGIGTLREKTLHAVIKRYIEPDMSRHEVKTAFGIVDIMAANRHIFEVQTRKLHLLTKKLSGLLNSHSVTVVYPIAHKKLLSWIDPITAEASKPRKSPKTGSFFDALRELYSLKPLLLNENLHIRLMLIDIIEYRLKNGWGNGGKRGSELYERIPTALYGDVTLSFPLDYKLLIPKELSQEFTAIDFSKAAHISLSSAQRGVNLLCSIGVIECIGKLKRSNLYAKVSTEEE